MIQTLLFDFGDIFINLDKEAPKREFFKLGITQMDAIDETCLIDYEIGKITTSTFVNHFCTKYNLDKQQFIDAWNSILLDFPKHRLEFVQQLHQSKKYQLLLLSNTNDLHITWVKNNWKLAVYNQFYHCFDGFYLSHEIGLRKPNASIYEFILQQHQIKASEILFVDDTKINTDAAEELGFKVWNLNPKTEDVTQLFTKNFLP